MIVSTSAVRATSVVETLTCGIAAVGVVEATVASLPALREAPGRPGGRQIPHRFLRYAEDQSVVALAAVLKAFDEHRPPQICCDDWGVLGAPRFHGRMAGSTVLHKYMQGGPATTSPHAIPQLSLHAVASAVSVALGMRGLNLGIGGGPEVLSEALAGAMSFLAQWQMPGLWLVCTEWNPEPIPDSRGANSIESICRGVALALVPSTGHDLSMRLTPGEPERDEVHSTPKDTTLQLAELAHWLTSDPGWSQSVGWSHDLPWGGRVEMLREARL